MNDIKTTGKQVCSSNFAKYCIAGIAFALVLFHLYSYSREIAVTIQPYRIGDWLINYQGGFVRRGFIGEFIYLISTNRPNTIWIAYAIQSISYLVLSYFVLKLFFVQKSNRVFLLFLFSPAFIFVFPLYDLEGWFRKELLVFTAYVLMVYGLRNGVFRLKYLWISFLTYSIAVFSHEAASLALVFFLLPLYVIYKRQSTPDRKIIFFGAAYILIAIVGLIFSVLIPGDLKTAEKVCMSLTARGIQPGICDGAIQYLTYGASHGVQEVIGKIKSRYYFEIYLPLLALALLPVFLVNWWRTRLPILILGFVSLIPLFVVGMDWGRWIVIYITLIYLSILFDGTLEQLQVRKISFAAVFLYATLWSVPHIQGWPTRMVETYFGSGPGLGVVDLVFAKIPHEITVSPLRSPVWNHLIKKYDGFVFYPLVQKSSNQDIFYYFGLKNSVSSNISRFGKFDEGLIKLSNEKIGSDIWLGNLDRNLFYIFDQETALDVLQNLKAPKDLLAKIDGFIVFAPNWKTQQDLQGANSVLELDAYTPIIKIGTPILFSAIKGEKPLFLYEGWSLYSEDWGTWSDGSEAVIKIPVPAEHPKALQLEFAAFLPGSHSSQTIDIFLDDKLVKKVTVQRADTNLIDFSIPQSNASQRVMTIKFLIAQPLSPYELGLSMDRRKLGIGIKSAIFR